MRNRNIQLGKTSDEIIIGELMKLDKFKSIVPIRDNQQKRNSLQGILKLEDDINMRLGIDYVLEFNGNTYYIDTKGFTYDSRYYGSLNNGVVELLLLQVEKYYRGISRKGWSNDNDHWTDFILILINNHIYFINYKRLVTYCNNIQVADVITFNKGNGNYEKCIQVPVNKLQEANVITSIIKVDDK